MKKTQIYNIFMLSMSELLLCVCVCYVFQKHICLNSLRETWWNFLEGLASSISTAQSFTKISSTSFPDLQWSLILFGDKWRMKMTSVVFSSCGTYCTQSLRGVWKLTDKWVSAATCSVELMSSSLYLRWAYSIWSGVSPLALRVGLSHTWQRYYVGTN